jgi:SOS response regulatory protein OraA/RecX
MRRALLQAGHAEEETEAVLGRLRRESLLDDGRFSARFAASRIGRGGMGSRRVRQALERRGVAPRVAAAGLAEALRDVSEADTLDRVARSYWRQRSADDPERRVRRLWRFLLGRGFSADLVRERVRALWPKHGDVLEGMEPLSPEDMESA